MNAEIKTYVLKDQYRGLSLPDLFVYSITWLRLRWRKIKITADELSEVEAVNTRRFVTEQITRIFPDAVIFYFVYNREYCMFFWYSDGCEKTTLQLTVRANSIEGVLADAYNHIYHPEKEK